jgi:peptidoglycan/xylan/chitin deacetylase (PgdA/CDA1 family)
LKRTIKSILSKVNFGLNRNPRIARGTSADDESLIPQPYEAVLLLCADFELAWAWRYAKGLQKPKEEAIKLARLARGNIPRILKLCDTYNIPITWATVGHLFLEKCKKNDGVPHSQLKRPAYHENQYWKFDTGEWYDDDPCTDWKTSPEWYAPDLIKAIINSDVDHEIACHTFSHIDCRDAVCTADTLDGEITECQKHGQVYGVKMKSFVHPGHTIGNLDTLMRLGFTSYRTDYYSTLGLPVRHRTGLWELQTSAEIYYRNEWSTDYHIYRFCTIIDRGVKHRRIVYFRFHPSFNEIVAERILEALFSYIAELRDKGKLLVTNTKEYVNYLNNPMRGVTA